MICVGRMLSICILALLAACDNPSGVASTTTNEELERVSSEAVALRKELTQMMAELELLKRSVSRAHAQIRLNAPRYKAEFDPSESSYQAVDSNLGRFAVSVEDVRQFADGVRIKLNLGNLSSATYNGATIKISYGPRAPTDSNGESADAWLNSLQEREVPVTTKL